VASQKSSYFVDFPAGSAVPVLSVADLLLWETLIDLQKKYWHNFLSSCG